jgi:hypothetical protein
MTSIDQTAATCKHPASLPPACHSRHPMLPDYGQNVSARFAIRDRPTIQNDYISHSAAFNKLNKSARRSGHTLAVAREPRSHLAQRKGFDRKESPARSRDQCSGNPDCEWLMSRRPPFN